MELLEAFGDRLVHLGIERCEIEFWLAGLVMAALPRLETLSLSGCDLGDGGLRLLERTPPGRMPRLRALDLRQVRGCAHFRARELAAFPELDLETGLRW